jgi:hypothetical protein
MRNLETYFDPEGSPLVINGTPLTQVAAQIKPDQLVTATTEFSKFEVSVSSLYAESSCSFDDPWIHCPACASTLRSELNDGEYSLVHMCTLHIYSLG